MLKYAETCGRRKRRWFLRYPSTIRRIRPTWAFSGWWAAVEILSNVTTSSFRLFCNTHSSKLPTSRPTLTVSLRTLASGRSQQSVYDKLRDGSDNSFLPSVWSMQSYLTSTAERTCVRIKAAPHSGSEFLSSKGHRSTVLMAMHDYNVGSHGRETDGVNLAVKLLNFRLDFPPTCFAHRPVVRCSLSSSCKPHQSAYVLTA